MSGVNGELQFTGIQSLSWLTPPFTLRATVTPTVAAANAFVVLLVSADGKTWLALHGNPQPASGHQGVAINYSSQAEPKDVPGITLYPNPTLGVTYTTQVILDPAGNGLVQLLNAKGSLVASQAGIQVGTAPLYLVLGQREGQPMVQGPNVAVWQSVSAARPRDASLEERLEPMVNKPSAGQGPKSDSTTGTWKVEGVAFAPWTFTLQGEGDKLTGTVSQRGLVSDEAPATIYGGAIQGNQITFNCDSADGGRTVSFSGVLAGDSITFTREVTVHPGGDPGFNGLYGAYGPAQFTARRVPAPAAASAAQGEKPKPCLTKFDRQIVDAHEQRYGMSCIPMSIELVSKLLGRVSPDYYELQTAWKEKADGSFRDFNGKTIKGVTFHQQFDLKRNGQFPLTKLFETIDRELKEGRFVIVSLASASGWHMYVIYDEDADGDFLAVSKAGSKSIEEKHLKSIITKMQGTDIMTYEVKP